MESQQFIFYSDKLEYKAIDTERGREYYLEGYISTEDEDLVNDVVTKSGLKSMLEQFKKRSIKLDFEHEAFRGLNKIDIEANKTRLPLGKAVSYTMDNKGVKVTWKMNTNWKKFDEKGNVVMTFEDVWNNVQDGMLDAFSIAYIPTRTAQVNKEGKSIRLLDDVNLLNVALTGNAINPAAKMTAVMAKSLEFMEQKELEVDNLDDVEIKNQAELKYKYIKRTGSPGHYRYWYRNPKTGKLYEGKKPQQISEYEKERLQSEAMSYLSKKPQEFRDVGTIPENKIKDLTAGKKVKVLPDVFDFNELINKKLPKTNQFYKVHLRNENADVIINTEGYDYARYMAKIKPLKKPQKKSAFQRAEELGLSVDLAELFIKANPDPDCTGLHGRGLGPGQGRADGTGLKKKKKEEEPEKKDSIDNKNVRSDKMAEEEQKESIPENKENQENVAEQNNEVQESNEASESVENESAEAEQKSMTLTEMKNMVETLYKEVKSLRKENEELKAIVNKPILKARGPEDNAKKTKVSEVKSLGPIDYI